MRTPAFMYVCFLVGTKNGWRHPFFDY